MAIKTIEDLMVSVPTGSISMRDDRKKESWNVKIEEYLLCKFPITQELYFSVMSVNPSAFVGKNKPVESVCWYDSIAFCNALSEIAGFNKYYSIELDAEAVGIVKGANGYRLPTDAEWEYACRAGSRKVQYGQVEEIAWFEGNSDGTTHDAGLKSPNEFGLFDMLGNVWEWCWDVYDPEVYGAYRIFRGGGWCDGSRGCLASNRRRSHPTFTVDDLGFRVARSM